MIRATLFVLALVAMPAHADMPDVENPHWFEIINCGERVKSLWITPDFAGEISAARYESFTPEQRQTVDDVRQQAEDAGNLRALRLSIGCTET